MKHDSPDVGNAFPTLQTARLQLRRIVTADAPRVLEILGNREAMKWFGSDPLPDLHTALELITRLEQAAAPPTTGIRWGLAERGQDELIGSCGLMGWRRQSATCKVGYELHPQMQGTGLMAEALREVFEFGFEIWELNRIVADVHPDNLASRRVVERLGFVAEGTQRDGGYWDGRHHDLILYSLLRSDWTTSLGR